MEGKRFNTGKTKWSLLDLDSLVGVVEVFQFGVQKYGLNDWKKGLKVTETLESSIRHIHSFLNKEDIDLESGLHHIDHAITNLIMVRYMTLFNKKFDDRFVDVNKICCGKWDGYGKCTCK